MNNELEYKETLEQTIPKNAYEHFIYDLQETYRSEFGWEIKNIKTTTIDDNNIKITLDLEKYKTLESSKTR